VQGVPAPLMGSVPATAFGLAALTDPHSTGGPAARGQKLVTEVPVVPAANPAMAAGICRSGAGEAGLQSAALRSSSAGAGLSHPSPPRHLTNPSRLCPSLLSQQETTA